MSHGKPVIGEGGKGRHHLLNVNKFIALLITFYRWREEDIMIEDSVCDKQFATGNHLK